MSLLLQLSNLSRRLPVSRSKARIGRIFTRLLPSSLFPSVAPIAMDDGSVLLLDARSRTEAGAFWNGEYEPAEFRLCQICAAGADTVLDVGANVGLTAIPLARTLKPHGGKLIALEPVPSNFNRLVQSIALNDLNGVVLPFPLALGDKEGEIEFARESKGNASTGNALPRDLVANPAGYAFSTAKITTLDAFALQNHLDSVDFVKVDIEGAEVGFLQGGEAFLQRCRPIIFGEFNSQLMPKYGHTFLDVAAILKPWKYKIFASADTLMPIEVTAPESGLGNILLVPEEKAAELLKRIAAARQTR